MLADLIFRFFCGDVNGLDAPPCLLLMTLPLVGQQERQGLPVLIFFFVCVVLLLLRHKCGLLAFRAHLGIKFVFLMDWLHMSSATLELRLPPLPTLSSKATQKAGVANDTWYYSSFCAAAAQRRIFCSALFDIFMMLDFWQLSLSLLSSCNTWWNLPTVERQLITKRSK